MIANIGPRFFYAPRFFNLAVVSYTSNMRLSIIKAHDWICGGSFKAPGLSFLKGLKWKPRGREPQEYSRIVKNRKISTGVRMFD